MKTDWLQIAAVYCVCGALAKEAAEAAEGEPALELVAAPAAAMADLLHEEAGSWVASHGGWVITLPNYRQTYFWFLHYPRLPERIRFTLVTKLI